MLEKDLQKSIQQRLGIYELTGEILWWGRLQSLKVKTIMGTWIQGCPKGTPDLLALIRNREDGISPLFLELKSSTGVLRKEQKQFIEKYSKKSGVYILEIRDPRELDVWIEKYAKDFVSLLPNSLESI